MSAEPIGAGITLLVVLAAGPVIDALAERSRAARRARARRRSLAAARANHPTRKAR